MDLAVLTCVVGKQPLAIRSNSSSIQYDLAQICASYDLECQMIRASQLAAPEIRDGDTNVIIVEDLHTVPRNTQVDAIELIRARAKRVQDALFLLIALLPLDVEGPPYLTPHLNDLIFFIHTDDPSDDVDVSLPPRTTTQSQIRELQHEASVVRTSAEIRRYTHDIVTFLRLNRAVAGGVSAIASRQLVLLTRNSVLAVLNNLTYVTPSLVAMAARKAFLHRIIITTPEKERSMQWGSDLAAVAEALEGASPETVVEEVLRTVDCPL